VGGRRPVLEAIRSGRARTISVARDAHSSLGLRELIEAADRAGVPLHEVDREELDRVAPDHRGVVAELRPVEALGERELARWSFAEDAIVVVLDGVTDPQNLGAAARSAEAAGAAMLVSRTRRAAEVTPSAIRASAGALLHLPHARVANVARALERLKDLGFTVVGLSEQAPSSVYDAPAPTGRVVLVLGDEGVGLSRLVRESCDLLVSLPMRGSVPSLNASASLAAALYAYVLPTRR
jgi:23S rRNA (guanosine2251-2'-O)-methyltransferase